MELKQITILNFKNLSEIALDFNPSVNCFLGNNGEGKTNMLDAIHYLSYTKSFFNPIDSQNIQFETPFFMIQGDFRREQEDENVFCGLKRGEKKIVKWNKKNYARLADHIGKYPVVIITPYDSNLITDGSDVRRKFLDGLIAQFDKEYLYSLVKYNKLLQQRNALLKQFMEGAPFQQVLLDVFNDQMVPLADQIFEKRNHFINGFLPVFTRFYSDISSGKEEVSLSYESQLSEKGMQALLLENQPKDLRSTYTTMGIHKDDLVFRIGAGVGGSNPLKKFGSQGQQKSFLIALKLAQFDYVKSKKGYPPILLLDDIFDKLDDTRINYLLSMLKEGRLGQTFITDTSTERVPKMLEAIGVSHNSFEMERGMIKMELA